MEARQVTQNQFPCCFLPHRKSLEPGESLTIYSLYGQAEDKGRVAALAERIDPLSWFSEKRKEAQSLVNTFCAAVDSKTADPVFDAYTKQTYWIIFSGAVCQPSSVTTGRVPLTISIPGSMEIRSGNTISSLWAGNTMPRATATSGM